MLGPVSHKCIFLLQRGEHSAKFVRHLHFKQHSATNEKKMNIFNVIRLINIEFVVKYCQGIFDYRYIRIIWVVDPSIMDIMCISLRICFFENDRELRENSQATIPATNNSPRRIVNQISIKWTQSDCFCFLNQSHLLIFCWKHCCMPSQTYTNKKRSFQHWILHKFYWYFRWQLREANKYVWK